ncbi:hypothetical protein CBR_g8481 [Chara braunii]|uniref:Reverse transcriptase domain-containing protein n=1 Tax=Chara braunii TaxID=69332 RepID=A0A388KM97_CHABU|nr:hypothetical protein CBR_g8481 [Chara braunii]|eukprot:GBG71179.1 hypothetical protein CBR_g8481 [Chara braunii]
MHLRDSRGRGFFRLNDQVLEVPGVREWVATHMASWEQTRRYFETTADWLDGGLATTSGILNVISRIVARERNKKEAECKRRVEEAEEKMEGHPISAMVWAAERERRLSEWTAIQDEKEKRWTDILKVKGIETSDKMTKENFQRLLPKRTQQQMVELRHPFDATAPTTCAAYALYTVSTSAVMVNGHLSEPFALSRSLRQGCSLAPLVFVLQLEVLLNRIRKHPDIRGLQLHTGEECKVKALADDLFAVCENSGKSLTALKSVLREYCSLSEATVNWNKSTYLLPAQFNLQVEWGMRRVESGEEERFLGVLVSLQVESSSQGLLLQQRISARLRLWGHTWHLSLIGRALVANVALLSIMWFVTTVKEVAEGVIRVIKQLVARFVWKPRAPATEGFLSKVAYDTLTFPRPQGGLGLMDPGRRNQAQLWDWVAKVANAKERDQWFGLAERILMREWELSRPQDVWDCFFIPSFRKRRPKSVFWEPIRKAWHRTPPNTQSPPATRDEVLKQILFENPAITNQAGQTLAADGTTGSFGQAWVRKGVVRISDLWSTSLGGWKPQTEVKAMLRGLQRTEEHWQEIINAIPRDWLEMLGPEGVDPAGTMLGPEGADPAGTWYIPGQEGEDNTLWKVLSVLPSGFRKVERWRCEGPPNQLTKVDEDIIMVWNSPAQARVVTIKGTRPSALIYSWVGKVPLNQLCIDPTAWKWTGTPDEEAALSLQNYSVNIRLMRKTPPSTNFDRLGGQRGQK